MRIIPWYVMRGFLLTFALALLVFTFIICIMVLFNAADYIAAGGDWQLIGKIFLAGLPSAFGFSTPVSLLTAALLTFGRLSASGEISAMKAGGISMKRLLLYPCIVGLLLSGVCYYLNAQLTPRGFYMRRQALLNLGIETPLALIEEGKFIRDFPGFAFYIGGKKDNRIWDIIIYQNEEGHKPRNIRAKSGTLTMSPDKKALLIDLVDVRIDPFSEDRPGIGLAKHFPLKIDFEHSAAITRSRLPRAYLAPGKAAVTLGLTHPRGFSLDQAAPSQVAITANADLIRFAGANPAEQIMVNPAFPLHIPLVAAGGDAEVVIHYNLNFTQRGGPAFTFTKEAYVTIPITVTKEVTNTLIAAEYNARQEKKRSDMTLGELREQIDVLADSSAAVDPDAQERQQMSLIVEFHKRIVLALSCFTFVLLGVPLATKAHRSESSIGVAISLFLVFFFYMFIIVADSLAKSPAFKPYLLAWLPIVLSIVLGAILIQRCE